MGVRQWERENVWERETRGKEAAGNVLLRLDQIRIFEGQIQSERGDISSSRNYIFFLSTDMRTT